MRVCYRFSTGVTEAGKLFDGFVAVLILLNVAAVIAESEPSLGGSAGSSDGGRFQLFFDGFEVIDQNIEYIYICIFFCLFFSKLICSAILFLIWYICIHNRVGSTKTRIRCKLNVGQCRKPR